MNEANLKWAIHDLSNIDKSIKELECRNRPMLNEAAASLRNHRQTLVEGSDDYRLADVFMQTAKGATL